MARPWSSTFTPLSDAPRFTRGGAMPTLDPTPIWDEDFATRSVTIVNLHGKGDYDAAKDAASEGWEILLEREPDNEFDPNAVIAYLDESNCTA